MKKVNRENQYITIDLLQYNQLVKTIQDASAKIKFLNEHNCKLMKLIKDLSERTPLPSPPTH